METLLATLPYAVSKESLESVADAIRAAGKTHDKLVFPDGFIAAIDSIATGSGVKNDVNFYDYDGSIVDSYSAKEFLELESMPQNPTHAGLISQGWNWTLEIAKTFVRSNGMLEIGQMYKPESGATEIDITLTAPYLSPTISIAPNGTVAVDWGDGSEMVELAGTSTITPKFASHTYGEAGSYTIKLTVANDSFFCFYGGDSKTRAILSPKKDALGYSNVYTNDITAIRVGENVGFGTYALNYCESMRYITLPDSTAKGIQISNGAFANCSAIKHLTLPIGTTVFADNAALNDRSLKTISLPQNMTQFGVNAFNNCGVLERVTIPGTVVKISDAMFTKCQSLVEVTMHNGISALGSYSFMDCKSLEEITIPEAIKTIPMNCFEGCISLRTLSIPKAVTQIQNNAFRGCSSLTDVTLGSGLTRIMQDAFSSCYSLRRISFPSNVYQIGNYAFSNCFSLEEINLDRGTPPTLGGTYTFSSLPSTCVIYVPYTEDHSVLNAYKSAQYWSAYASQMVELVIAPEGEIIIPDPEIISGDDGGGGAS